MAKIDLEGFASSVIYVDRPEFTFNTGGAIARFAIGLPMYLGTGCFALKYNKISIFLSTFRQVFYKLFLEEYFAIYIRITE
ncbi:MAG: hypothetical protein JGK28_17425 [Microcoleus sp. PH2017_07_MST_O_A]|uniref:hypothetical protein n=1 Tax=unclassified Microcoleus TaxID=2642155 RepID=UPI001DD71DCC|nr:MULTISPECIES: hypothetical protein [unclassified Microcoleus]MCC3419652.1 hypothetical protein [Microcoleus sp. PH2017_07_MST_O_A]MCC3507706.1 hypothetical protein [Microcoleus sp. PH2017_17_BER_D_A]MCC3583063.1 hypothetical protein [Microcoleus sp. PH2017_30_WIL_O_A]TAG00926.1 MAG: hypothetical protein EAZ45_14255 [Oscillatoriales cyanobacterium]MCC3434335.1 hypothetical protein [Microcoleus sp. PH2017_05_CCC_O_A]